MKKNIIVCFCKHPVPGLVKSRLAKDLGNEQAASIYKTLLNETLKNSCNTNFEVILYCYPDVNHELLQNYKNKFNIILKPQQGDDLGMKMHHAINAQLNSKTKLVLIGSDCLEIDANYIHDAFKQLESGIDIVLGPAVDGGYALIGANKIDHSIFQAINWSSDAVLKQTIEKINKLGWTHHCLESVRDLDNLEDYQYYSGHKKYRNLF